MLIVVPFFHPIITDAIAKTHQKPGGGTSGGGTSGGGTSGGGITVYNPWNPQSPRSFTFGGNTWTLEPTSNQDGYGDVWINRNGTPIGYAFEFVTTGTSLYAYNLEYTNWYQWSGSSWSAVGSAPPFVTGTGVPFILGDACCSATPFPWTSWLGRIPDYADNYSGTGTIGDWSPGINLGGGTLPTDLAYAMVNTTWNSDGSVSCLDPNGATYSNSDTVMQAIAAGNYDQAINYQIQNYLVPVAGEIYYIRISHEWPGSWYCDSPWYNASEQSPNVPPADWIAAWQHVHDLLKAKLPNVKFEWDGPSDATQAAYYPGDNYVDLIGIDDYVGAYATDDSSALAAWQATMIGQTGGANLSYLLPFQQQHNKPFVMPEWADQSEYSSPTGINPIVTQFANLFASLSVGPGNAVLVAQSVWDNDAGCTCGLADYPGRMTAYGQPWPNGFANTHYSGAYWPTPLIPMPTANFWD
jgi:Glycosyl hydrolase family 26